jgi:predicted aspartyl protease
MMSCAFRCTALALTVALGSAHAGVEPGDPVVTAPIAAPPATQPAGPPDHLFAAPTRPDRIGRIMAPVIINGRGPFRLIVDTGANQSVLTSGVADLLGLQPAQDGNVKLSGVTGSAVVPTITVDTFATGDLLQRNLRMALMRSVSGGAEGILGMQGFEGKRITVDFAHDRIEIADSRGERAGHNFAVIPVTIRFGRLLLAAGRVGGVKVQVVIDTGAERTIGNAALRDALIRRKRLPAPPTSAGVIGLTEVEQRGDSIWTRQITLGDVSITDVNVIYGDIHVFKVWDLENEPALLIGMDVLGTLHTLVVDYRLKQLQIRPRNSQLQSL